MSTFTLRTLRPVFASDRSASGVRGPVLVAVCALAIGVAAYAFLRPHAAAFLPAGLHRPLSHALPAAALGSLSTFVHALAMPLLIAALIGARRGALLATVCAVWCAVEIGFELAQHPAVGLPLLAGLPSALAETRPFTAFSNFVRLGTFDPLDIAAAALASLVAFAVLTRWNAPAIHATEGSHA